MLDRPAEARKRRLVELLAGLSYQRRRVVLASGRESDFYVDGKQTTLHAEGAFLVGSLIEDLIHAAGKGVRGVGGLTIGADPIATATSVVSFLRGRPVHAFLVRKEPKGHGTGQWLEGRGNLPAGSAVCVVEDTATTGGSTLRAIERATADGLRVVQVVTVVDREEGARENLLAAGHTLQALVTRRELEAYAEGGADRGPGSA